MNHILQRFINLGTSPELDDHINLRLKATNVLTGIILLFGTPIIYVCSLEVEGIWFMPVLFILIFCNVFLLNFLEYHLQGRILLSVGLALFAWLILTMLTPKNHGLSPTFSIVLLLPIVCSFTVFGIEDKKYLIACLIFQSVVYILTPSTLEIFNYNVPLEFYLNLRSGWLSFYLYAAILICIIGGLFFMNNNHYHSQLVNTTLLKDAQNNNIILTKKEELLQKSLQELKLNQEEEKKRAWISEGLSQLTDILRIRNVQLNNLLNLVLSFIVKYTNSNQGGVFLINESKVKLVGMYAYNRKKYIEKEFELGEGLIGQCILEKEYIYLTDIPKDYIQITSGLGEALPRAIIIIPFIFEEEILGAIELATFYPYDPYAIDFLLKASNSISLSISNLNSNQKMMELHEMAKIQSEKLRQQEEETRQSLEELVATQEELYRKEKELTKQLESKVFEIEQIRVQEKDLLNSKLNAQKEIYDTIIKKLKEKVSQD